MKPLKMMIVDDDMSTRSMLAAILRSFDCGPIITVSDGAKAVLTCLEKQPDIVWMDIDMPVKNGFESLRAIRMGQPDMFVTMVSGYSTMSHVKQSMDLGANGFVVKPFTTAKVKDILDKYYAERNQQAS